MASRPVARRFSLAALFLLRALALLAARQSNSCARDIFMSSCYQATWVETHCAPPVRVLYMLTLLRGKGVDNYMPLHAIGGPYRFYKENCPACTN